MNFRLLSKILGILLLLMGGTQSLCLAYAYRFDPRHDGLDSFEGLLLSVSVDLVAGCVLLLLGRGGGKEILRKEAIAIVGLSWIVCAFFGAIPYLVSEPRMQLADAFFESMSGFTTTGASIIPDLEQVPRGILLWRGLTQWLGGLGILVLFVALLSYLGVGSKALFRHESSAKESGGLQARIHDVALRMWQIYLALSLVLFGGFILLGMPFFDAVCHTFTTVSTGGFSPHNRSLGHYNDPLIECWAMLFMILGGVSFMLYAWLLRGKWGRWKKEEETKYFLGVLLVATALIAGYHVFGRENMTILHALRVASFQVVSILTTAGFVTADYDLWPTFPVVILLALMVIGGCTGSTSGGIKISRWLLFARTMKKELNESFRPNVIRTVGLNGNPVDAELQRQTMFFIAIAAVIIGLTTVITSLLEPQLDLVSSLSASMAIFLNIGPALGQLGPTETYAALKAPTKLMFALLMAVGRLEIFAILVLFFPSLWRKY
ncbi:MAG: TrkH family potassium uptake protein [Verrucomicrobiota bacterium]|nr:TrkH family potassium uptake protein [Verrucomicrobiota bacterium]MDG1891665.1 TrkH family potassium uptake protein [Verrucomicrobiota bacterium]